MLITPEFIQQFFTNYRYTEDYKECLQYNSKIEQLVDAEQAMHALMRRHPSEDEWVFEHRKRNFRCITKAEFNAVLTNIAKIQRNNNFLVSYKPDPARIREGERLQDYCERNFPQFDSIQNWLWSYLLRNYLKSPNDIIAIEPLSYDVATDEFLQPMPVIIDAKYVAMFDSQNQICVVLTYDSNYSRGGKRVRIYNETQILEYQQVDNANYQLTFEHTHNFGYMPVFRLGGVVSDDGKDVYESVIGSLAEYWIEALLEYSDLQGAMAQHCYPEKWQYSNDNCRVCSGTGTHYNEATKTNSTCNNCKGKGVIAGVYAMHLVKPGNIVEGQPIIPPAGYISKELESTRLLREEIEKNIYKGYCAINMQHLAQVPAAQSGIAKAIDRDDLNTFLHSVATHLANNILSVCYYFISKWRYSALLSEAEIVDYQPIISIASQFDISSTNMILGEIKAAVEASVSTGTLRGLMVNYANKLYEGDVAQQQISELEINLNPLLNKTTDEVAMLQSGGTITQVTAIIYSNIADFVRKAYYSNSNYFSMAYQQQYEILIGYANEVIAQNNKQRAVGIVNQNI